MKRPIVIGNWKMFFDISRSTDMILKLRDAPYNIDEIKNVDIVLAPSYLALSSVKDKCAGSVIRLAAQDAFYIQTGPYCGAVSPDMLKGLCEFVFVGHSERRTYFHDTDETVNLRLSACIESGLTPVLCTGEPLEIRNEHKTKEYVLNQLYAGLKRAPLPAELIVQYEPVWSLGTGIVPEPEDVNEILFELHSAVKAEFGLDTYSHTRFIYAGSVKPSNAAKYASLSMADGLSVGSASLQAESFFEIIKTVSAIN